MPDPISSLFAPEPQHQSAGVKVPPRSNPISFFRLSCAYAGKRANTMHVIVNTVLRSKRISSVLLISI